MQHSRRTFLKALGTTATVGTAALSAPASAVTYTIDTDLTNTVPYTGSQIDQAIYNIRSDSGLYGLGDTFVNVGNTEGINAIYIAAHAAWESAWGTSQISQDKNNLFGWGAYDSCPYSCAKSFSSKAECVSYVMSRIKDWYLTPGGQYYTSNGPTLRGMNVNYATDINWAEGIRDVMNSIVSEIPTDPQFSVDDRVATTTDLNIRMGPGTNYEVNQVASSGSAGYIVDGPQTADGYTWWKVAFNSGFRGWGVQQYLEAAPV